jgi:pimeloyl-[acyl-carrier protein] methyl ester esterase
MLCTMLSGRLHVESLGSGEDLTLLHGWGMHGGVWEEAAHELGRRFRVHLIDLPGHGRSSRCARFNLAELTGAVSRAAQRSTHVCGWSLGGLVALAWANSAPRQVKTLVLVATTPCFATRRDWRCALAPELLQTFAGDLRRNCATTLSRFAAISAAESSSTLARLKRRLIERGQPSAIALDSGLQVLLESDLRPLARRITQRALVLHGDTDRIVPLAAGKWLSEHLQWAELEILRGCGHVPFIARPARLAELIVSFVYRE